MNLQTLTLSTLKPAPYNPRKISEDAMGRLEKSVKEWGIVDPLIVNKATGYTIIGGHQRFKVLQKQGAQTADCVVLDLPPAKEKALNIALNNQKMAGEYEFSTLADILQEIDTGEFSVPDLTGFSDEDLAEIANWTPDEDKEGKEETESIPEPPEKAISQLGDLWELGDHRLLCGDSFSKECVESLMNGNQAHALITSPPYYNARMYSVWDSFDKYMADMETCVALFSDNSSEYNFVCWNICHIRDKSGAFDIPAFTSTMLHKRGLEFFERIIWRKPGGVFDCPRSMHIENGHYFPAYGYEDILVYGKKHPKFEVRDKSEIREWQINVWDVPSVSTNDEKSNEGHPAQFPVKIPYQLMKSYSMDHAIIYEPFNGSGSTLIACEMTNRKCYAIEIEPRYIDVAVKRWQNYTGKKGKNLTRPEVGID